MLCVPEYLAARGGFRRRFLLERSPEQRGRVMEPALNIRERWKLLRPITPPEVHMDPCVLLPSGSAPASASFAPLIGPITLKVGDEEAYWHVGDGGLYENSGVSNRSFALPQAAPGERRQCHFSMAACNFFPPRQASARRP
jgi:hypothetical protein